MNEPEENRDFIRAIVAGDMTSNKHGGRVCTRFPPEPNGYLHIGHAKAAYLNFGIAVETGGSCNLRFDDTNPLKEDVEYVQAIQDDLTWLGLNWKHNLHFASDYFDVLYDYAVTLIRKGKAYVCDLTQDEIRTYRGTLKTPGQESPYRDRSVEDNLRLFDFMRKGKYAEGERVLRAKIDMASGNLNLRDPVMYRILNVPHHRTNDEWCIYPTYDFTQGQSDSIERVTHSICSLEFEDHRPLYDWFLNELEIFHPQQIEFARLNLSYTLMSKRKLLDLVNQKIVENWDDPRMPTLSGMRRRGFTPEAISDFCDRIGVAKRENMVDIGLLHHCVREDLNKRTPRVLAVLRPIKVVIENYPVGQIEELEAVNNPEDPTMGARIILFSRELYIDRDDFREDPPSKFHRLAPGKEVRLRYGYLITCTDVIKDENTGDITELRCTYDPETRGGQAPDGRRVKGTIHWVSAARSCNAEVRLYDHLFSIENPEIAEDVLAVLNPQSLEILKSCRVEESLADASEGSRYQFERRGYFTVDPDSRPGALVFNRTVSLRDSWAKVEKTSIVDQAN